MIFSTNWPQLTDFDGVRKHNGLSTILEWFQRSSPKEACCCVIYLASLQNKIKAQIIQFPSVLTLYNCLAFKFVTVLPLGMKCCAGQLTRSVRLRGVTRCCFGTLTMNRQRVQVNATQPFTNLSTSKRSALQSNSRSLLSLVEILVDRQYCITVY